tara:strand:- start:606 stop:812 length:207 start_codon:yes stop_codon:yes gene_type:complete
MGKQIILIGFFLVIVGGIYLIIEKNEINYDNPLDFKFEKGNTKFYFPLGSSILLSVVLSLIFYLFRKM